MKRWGLVVAMIVSAVAGCSASRQVKNNLFPDSLFADPPPPKYSSHAEEEFAKEHDAQVAKARLPPSPMPSLPFDPQAAATSPPIDVTPERICESWRLWTGYQDAIPFQQYERFRKHSELFEKSGFKTAKADQDWLMVILYRAAAVGRRFQSLRDEYKPALVEPDKSPLERLRVAVAIEGCYLGKPPSPAADVLSRREESARCDPDPACVAQREKDYVEKVVQDICSDLSARKIAKEDARAEWRSAREVGVVNVQSLSDSKTQMEIADMRAAEGMDSYQQMTGKKFNAKKACR